MQSFQYISFSPFLFLSLLFLSSFHGELVKGQQIFNFSTGKIDSNSLFLQNGVVDSSGTLILDSTTGNAQAFYSSPISLISSFTSFFTFVSNVTNGNGTIAFVFTPEATDAAVNLTEARKTLTIEFNTNCSTGVFDESFYGGHAFPGRGRGNGRRGGLGGFQVTEYANGTNIQPQNVSGYGPNWSGTPADGGYFCSQQNTQDLTYPTFQYQVVVEYNASTDTIWVGSPSCGVAIARTSQFPVLHLSSIITKPVYVGFLVSGGGVFNISQWNFTNNVNTSSVSSLALSSVVSSTPTDGSSDGSNSDGGRGHSDGKLKKGYVIAFSILGAAIGVAAVLLVCCLCARRRRVTSAKFVAKGMHAGTIPESAVVFDAKKPHAAPAKVVLVDRDTTPLNTHPNSTFHASTGAASWLQPVAPR